MSKIYMNDTKSQVKAWTGASDEEWRLFEVEATYQYKMNIRLFDPGVSWKDLDRAQRGEAVTRLEDWCAENGITWGATAAEWKLYQLHRTAGITEKNKRQTSTAESTRDASDTSVVTSEPVLSQAYDPVKDAVGK